MSSRSTQPAEQQSQRGVSPHEEHHDHYLNGDSSGSQENPPPPSYTVVDGFIQFDPDLNDMPTEAHANALPANSPSQLPFDDLIGNSIGSNSLAVSSRHNQDSLESTMAQLQLANQGSSNHKSESLALRAQQRQSQRPELPHAPRSAPDTRKLLGKISELEEVDPYGESPFEAARRAQRQADLDVAKPPSGQTYVNVSRAESYQVKPDNLSGPFP